MHTSILVLAQAAGRPEPAWLGWLTSSVACVVFLLAIAVAIWMCVDLQRLLRKVPEQYRKQEPAMVWLLLIPLFNIVYAFFVFPRVSESYADYFQSRGRTDVGDAYRTLAIIFCISLVCTYVPCLNFIAAPASLVLLIVYLVKMHHLANDIDAGGIAPAPTTPPA